VDATTPLTEGSPAPPSGPASGRRRWLELAALVGCLSAALAGAALWSSSRLTPTPSSPGFDVARPAAPGAAPDFALVDLDGRGLRLADFRGRVVLLTFWATWCEPCREEMPAMQALAADLASRGLALVTVNYQETAERIRPFVREIRLDAPVALDGDGAVAQRYRVVGLPATYLIDRRGALVGSILGYRDWRQSAARVYLERLLAAG
jgi:thiol-disulfide isomerase/thioredoxin